MSAATDKTAAPTPEDGPTRRRYAIWFLAIYALHTALTIYALPPDALLGDRPFASPDYQTHFGQTTTLTRTLDRFGKLWAYDPSMLAGSPVGLIFDVDNKLHFLFTYVLHSMGVKQTAAFNLFTFLCCMLAPLSLWLAARMFRVGRRAELIAVAFCTLMWHFDSSARAWTGGMVSFSMVAHSSLAVLGLYWRMLTTGRWRYLLPLALLLPLSLLTHVWSFSILVVPMVGLYLRHARSLPKKGHLQVWGLAIFALAANLHWLYPALQHFDLIRTSGVVGQATPLYILSDWLELLVSPINTGFAVPHTLFRFAAICGMGITLWRWRKEGDERFFIAALAMAWLFGMAYVAALIPGLKETEPYRFIMPGFLLAGVFAGPWYAEGIRARELRALPLKIKLVLAVAAFLLVPRIVAQVVYFIPELRPDSRLPPIVVDQAKAAPTTLIPSVEQDPHFLPKTWQLRGVDDMMTQLGRWVRESCTEEGRILVQHWAVAEFLRWSSGKPIIGGFPDRRMIHEDANLFRRPWDPRFKGKELAAYLVRYNIRYVIVSDVDPMLMKTVERRRDLMLPMKMIGGHRVYRVRHKANYFARGSGKVKADLNRIEVSDARPFKGSQALMLRFHHMRTLRCRPNCRLLKSPIAHDAVGFITVVGQPTLPRRFVIENVY
jgi:hypothetical protein